MLPPSRLQYVCSQCLSQARQQCGAGIVWASQRRPSPPTRHIDAMSIAFVSTQNPPEPASQPIIVPPPPPSSGSSGIRNNNKTKLPVRERLHLWAIENKDLLEPYEAVYFGDAKLSGKSVNSTTRSQTTGFKDMENLGPSSVGMVESSHDQATSQRDFEVGVDSRLPGDLVEMRPRASRTPVFAIYLGFVGGRHHFYGSQGRWIISTGFSSLFMVSNFASMAEVQPLLDEIPKHMTIEEFAKAQNDDMGPSRATGAHLLERMGQFQRESQEIYMRNMDNLDRARALLSDRDRVKYMSLFEMAEILLSPSTKQDGKFPASALYAVHTAIYRDEIAFKPLSPSSDCHRREHLFEVFPHSFMQTNDRVAAMVRNYWMSMSQMSDASPSKALEKTALGSFTTKARQIVLSNRQRRRWVAGGLEPSKESTIVPEVQWSQSSWEIISFLQWWASYELFNSNSRFNAYGPAILRIVDLYDDVRLDHSAGWTFLQEIGVIPLWEVPSRYKVRFPETSIVRGGGLARTAQPSIQQSTRPDIAAEYRVDKPEQTVFCIDGPGAVLIDDGISLERGDKDDEFWIHVHAADPASGIRPNSELSRYMEVIPENIYLQGHFQAMLSDPAGGGAQGEVADLVKQYSLARGVPALTFSAKVNGAGDMLDYKVEPTSLHDVVYMDPEDVAEFCNEQRPPPTPSHSLSVGTPPDVAPASLSNREMTKVEELNEHNKQSILTLYRLAEALRRKRLDRGAWPYFLPGSSIQVQFETITSEDGTVRDPMGSGLVPPDPYISVSKGQDTTCSVVSNLMVLAGQVAARWCADRKIPVPYRRDTKSASNFAEALDYAKNTVYPEIYAGREPKTTQRMHLATLTGGVEISTRPGPHFMMGLDMYAKATSPLRRFSDLLVHWQIHAALDHEHSTGRRLDADQDSLKRILPFPEEKLSKMLSLLHVRERMARTVSRADKDWVVMALARAWRFEGTAPRTFRFTVTSRWRPGLLGYIDLFNLDAMLDVAGLNDLVLIKDVKVGDEFDVEILDVNAHSKEIHLRALKHYPSQAAPPS